MILINKYIFPALASVSLLLSACKKDLLDVTPPDKLSTTIFWRSEADADLALTGLYNYLYAPSSSWACAQYQIVGWDGYTDDVYSQHDYGGGRTATSSGITPSSGGYVYSYYANNYRAIAAINSFLANVSKVLDGDKLNKYKAEAHFLRAFNYLYLAQLYGNVPIIKDDPFKVDFSKGMAKSPKAEVLKLVLDDLDIAIAALPEESYSTGHAVKGTALAYKVRALMEQEDFPAAAATARQVIESNKFSLNPDYSANFHKAGQRASNEILFSVIFQAPNMVHLDAALSVTMHRWGGYAGTQDLIDEYEDNDPRLNMTWFFPGDGADKGWPFDDPAVASPGRGEWPANFYIPRKWLMPGVRNPDYGLQGDNDFVLMRYADLKLLFAEAQNEAVGPDASVYQQVNEVRNRPGVNMPPLPEGLNKEQMRERIRHERRVELALEGIRYFDLRRWRIAKEKINGFAPNAAFPEVKLKYEDKYVFWPIPQTEIDRNHGILEQNPGY